MILVSTFCQTLQNMKETSRKAFGQVEEGFSGVMVKYTTVNGLMATSMVLECGLLKKVTTTQVNGSKENQVEIVTKASLRTP